MAQRFEAAKKAEQEAAEKAKQTQQEAAEAEQIQVQQGFIQYVVDAFDPAKYPLIATVRLPADDILGAAEAYYKEHQKAPTAEELLTAIESELKERVSKVVAPPTAPAVEIKPPPTGVRSNWKSDAPPVERKSKGTPADWTREALREVGIAVK